MKNIWRIFKADLKCLRTNVLAGIVVLGLLLTPSLYAWFNILGFWDPYSRTDNLEVAVANTDAGYQSTLFPSEINAGETIVSSLRADHNFKWVFVDEAEAVEGAKSGKYYAALVIPKDFSADLLTIFSGNVKRAEIIYYTNQKINAVAPKVTTEGATALSTEINQRFSAVVGEIGLATVSDLVDFVGGDGVQNYGRNLENQLLQIITGLNLASGQADALADLMDAAGGLMVKSGDLLGTIQGENHGIVASLNQASSGVGDEKQAISEALSALDQATAKLDELAKKLTQEGETKLNHQLELSPEAQAARDKVTAEVTGLKTAVEQLKSQVTALDSEFSTLKSEIISLGTQIDTAAGNLSSSAKSLATDLSATASGLRQLSTDLTSSQEKLSAVQKDLNNAMSSGDLNKVREILGENPADLATFVADPTTLTKIPVYGMADNGSAMTPFYTSLAIWVGSIFLVALMETNLGKKQLEELESRELAKATRHKTQNVPQSVSRKPRKITPGQLYLGRYLIFLLFSLIQATIVCFGDIFFLGVQFENLGQFFLTGWVCALVFSSIVYTLTISFSKVGESLAIILVVLQVASAGGIFPVVLSAPIFQAIYPFLPFVYSMNAFQGAMAGVYGDQFWTSIGTLLLFLIPMLALGLIFRRPVIKLNEKMVDQMEKSGVM